MYGIIIKDIFGTKNDDGEEKMIKNYKIITLCGSTKFKEEFFKVQKDLTLKGNIVISVGLFGHSGDSEVWENMDEGTLTKTKEMLDDMHKRKIDLADEIFVINVGGYIGESTKSEIEYAKNTGKKVNYLEEQLEKFFEGFKYRTLNFQLMENTIIDTGDDKNGSTYSKIELVQKEIIMQP